MAFAPKASINWHGTSNGSSRPYLIKRHSSQHQTSLAVAPAAGQGFGLQSSNPAGGSAGSVSGQGGKTATGQFVIQTCATKPAVLFAGSTPAGAVAATPGAEAAATAG